MLSILSEHTYIILGKLFFIIILLWLALVGFAAYFVWNEKEDYYHDDNDDNWSDYHNQFLD